MTAIRVDDCATRATLEAAITELRRKQNRMPSHWVDRRAEVADEIDGLVDRWLLADPHPVEQTPTPSVT